MSLTFILTLIALGAATGFAAGLLGIGGGMILVPFLTLIFGVMQFEATHLVHVAIATSLATILFTSISSIRAHHKRGAVRWPVALSLTPGIVIGSWIGPMIAARLDTRVLAGFFAVFVGFSAWQTLKNKKPTASRELPGVPGRLGAGGVIGLLSGMVGAGGGFISVPYMVWCNVPIHNAVATSAVLGFPIALAGTLSYIWNGLNVTGLPEGALGYVYMPALAAIAVASVLTAPLGAKVAHSMNTQSLKRAFAFVLFTLAGYMAYKALG